MSSVNALSPDTAYVSKPNIVYDGSANQAAAAETRAAVRRQDAATQGQETTSVAGAAVTLTQHIKR
jgi:hypothetical protein